MRACFLECKDGTLVPSAVWTLGGQGWRSRATPPKARRQHVLGQQAMSALTGTRLWLAWRVWYPSSCCLRAHLCAKELAAQTGLVKAVGGGPRVTYSGGDLMLHNDRLEPDFRFLLRDTPLVKSIPKSESPATWHSSGPQVSDQQCYLSCSLSDTVSVVGVGSWGRAAHTWSHATSCLFCALPAPWRTVWSGVGFPPQRTRFLQCGWSPAAACLVMFLVQIDSNQFPFEYQLH